MRRRMGKGRSGFRQLIGVVLTVAGAYVVVTALPRWLWLLALGLLLLWGGLVLAMGER